MRPDAPSTLTGGGEYLSLFAVYKGADRWAGVGDGGEDVEGVAPVEVKARRGGSNHEQVLWMFINGLEELGPNEVDEVVEMELVEDYEKSPDKTEAVRIPFLHKAHSATIR